MKYLLPIVLLFMCGCQPKKPNYAEILNKRLDILHDRIQLQGELTDSTETALSLMKDCANVGDPLWTKRKCQERKDAFLKHLKELEAENDALAARDKQLDEKTKQ